MKRTIEYSNLIVSVMGQQENKKGKEVRHSYPVENLAEIFKKYCKDHKSLKDSLVDIPEARSKKYQKVGIDSTHHTDDKKVIFYHFAVAYIQRDRETILTADLTAGCAKNVIELGDGKYQYLHLHVSVAPTTEVILLDGKCHNAPTEHLFQEIILPYLDPADFGLPTRDELRKQIRVSIKTRLQKNYEQVLNKRINDLQQISFTLVKPTAKDGEISKSVELKESSKEAVAFCKSAVASIFGADLAEAEFEELPIKRFKVSITMDDGYEASKLKEARKQIKGNVKDFIKNDYLKNSVLTYRNDTTDRVERALLRGLQMNRENSLEPEDYLDDKKMWSEQRESYFLLGHKEAQKE